MPGSVRRATVGVQGQQDLFGRHLACGGPFHSREDSRSRNILPLIPGPPRRLGYVRHLSGEGEECRALPCRSEQLDLAPGHAATPSDKQQRNRAQCLVSYLVMTTPPGNVRVSTRFRFTQLSSAVKNGVPPPTSTGWVTISYSSTSPARMAAPASMAPPTLIGSPSSALSRVISATASPVTRRVFQSTLSIVEENTTFGVSRQFRANSICAGGAPGCGSPVGQWDLIASHSLRPYINSPIANSWSSHHSNSSSLGPLQPRSSPGAAMYPPRAGLRPEF